MRHRQLNVQQQNLIAEQGIRREAEYWRTHAIPEPLRVYAASHGVQWDRSIIIFLEIDFPGMPQLFGLLLTQDEKFIRFEISTDEKHTSMESVDRWDDVNQEQNLGQHNRGTGFGKGALALKVLRDLNS